MKDQVLEMGLPPAPTKIGDSRTARWDGLGQVELDAINPKEIQNICSNAISDIFDDDLYDELLTQQKEEAKEYKIQVKKNVNSLKLQ